jgi:hypothetical protein
MSISSSGAWHALRAPLIKDRSQGTTFGGIDFALSAQDFGATIFDILANVAPIPSSRRSRDAGSYQDAPARSRRSERDVQLMEFASVTLLRSETHGVDGSRRILQTGLTSNATQDTALACPADSSSCVFQCLSAGFAAEVASPARDMPARALCPCS